MLTQPPEHAEHPHLDDPACDNDILEGRIKQAMYAQRDARDSQRIEKRIKGAGIDTIDRGITADRISRLSSQDLTLVGATVTGTSYPPDTRSSRLPLALTVWLT